MTVFVYFSLRNIKIYLLCAELKGEQLESGCVLLVHVLVLTGFFAKIEQCEFLYVCVKLSF